jgi:pimeloyl-ACP methyl ester carboxylesterase
MGWERGWWLLQEYRPERLARIMGVPKGWDASRDPDFLAIRRSLFPIASKRDGLVFDAVVSEPASNAFPLEEIDVPTLLVHAADDRLAPYERAGPAAARIPGARLVTVAAGGHLVLEHQAAVRMATTTFIASLFAESGRPRS